MMVNIKRETISKLKYKKYTTIIKVPLCHYIQCSSTFNHQLCFSETFGLSTQFKAFNLR